MRLKKAVAAAPPLQDFYFTSGRASALGLAGIAKELGDRGVEYKTFNFPRMNGRGRNIALPEHYDYFKPFLPEGERGPLSFFTGRKIYGPRFDEAARLIGNCQPDIVFLSLFAWTYGEDVLELASHLRKVLGAEVPIVLGGAGAAVFPSWFEQSGLFDCVLRGESETTLAALLDHLESGLPLEAFKEKSLPADPERPIHINMEDDNLLFHKENFHKFLTMAKRLFPKATSSAYPWGDSLSTEQMVTAFRLLRLSNLIKKEDKDGWKSKTITPVKHINCEMSRTFIEEITHVS